MESGEDAEIFLGIPFAAPPIGDLRFEKPQEVSKWNETLKAKEFPPACATHDIFMGHGETEDCLYLNIFKPKASIKEGYPVMFFVYGGGFLIGDTKTYGYKNISDNLVSKGIIVVTIQHRLGPFGFFTTGDSRIPGNYGLWDQLEALKFVNKIIDKFNGDKSRITIAGVSAGAGKALKFVNKIIDKFNGDKNRITIAGVSAGAGSVSLLGLSEEAYDLFSQILPMSGSAFSQWATKSEVAEISNDLADAIGCDKNSTTIKECLKAKNVSEFQKILKPKIENYVRDDINLLQIAPRMDGDFIKSNCLKKATKNAPKKPTFIGVCSQEATIYAMANPFFRSPNKYFNLPIEKAKNYSKTDLEDFVRGILGKEKYFGNKSEEFVKEVSEFYANQKSENHNSSYNFFFEQYVTIMSDLNFNIPALREAVLKAKNDNPTYFYVYDYNIDITDMGPKLVKGAAHGSAVVNLFGGLYKPIQIDESGKKVQKSFVDLIANFIKNGTPSTDSITVPSITPESFQYIDVGVETAVKKDLWKDRLDFWNRIGPKYGYDLASAFYY
uniref:Carboxylesterase type B domain-containing protein n=1 Tax=Panagrolaimus sp. ES5 TaxID=591445 RepID=A0AC34FVF1_9BILA